MYEPKCFARLRLTVTVLGFQSDIESYINMKRRSLNVTSPEKKHRFNETTAYRSDFSLGGVCPGGHLREESSVALWPQSMEVWGRVCCRPDIPESDTLTLSLSARRSFINTYHILSDVTLIFGVKCSLSYVIFRFILLIEAKWFLRIYSRTLNVQDYPRTGKILR